MNALAAQYRSQSKPIFRNEEKRIMKYEGEIKGKAKQAKGVVKEKLGKLANDRDLYLISPRFGNRSPNWRHPDCTSRLPAANFLQPDSII
jgi:hypothetical protein